MLDDIGKRCDMAIEILKRTNDGDDLDPNHLFLVQEAVNGRLSDEGIRAFEELYKSCKDSRYKKPWFHGVEHLTIDHEGYVYWKGVQIEHYSWDYCWSAKGKKEAEELAARCRHLESIGVKPTAITAIWRWDEYKAKKAPLTRVGGS